jgi:hypothetical protein
MIRVGGAGAPSGAPSAIFGAIAAVPAALGALPVVRRRRAGADVRKMR